ncbi:unnamed protein product [Adineta ricciae]|uniref:Uncharacterized protein n=1 Tax=Adineta ricciae TaxID=249248 RepID=A0A814PSD7_ADIRI|nr:unnamed protein product [Adineta ricciae]
MPITLKNLLLGLSLLLFVTLFIGTHATDTSSNNQLNNIPKEESMETHRYMAKRRFLPTRRELDEYLNDIDDDESHLNVKRYFLKSKRYFLNSKRNDVR